jgi:hypothetical protein
VTETYDGQPWDHVLVRNGKALGPMGTPPTLQLVASAAACTFIATAIVSRSSGAPR